MWLKHVAAFANLQLLRFRAVGRAVVLHDPPLELIVEPAHRSMLADVRVRQAPGDDAADVRGFFQHDDFRPCSEWPKQPPRHPRDSR